MRTMSLDLIFCPHVKTTQFALTTKASCFAVRPYHRHTPKNPFFCSLYLRVDKVWLCFLLLSAGCAVLCALTSHSAGSIWGPVCSLQCLWSDTVPNRPPPLWQKGLAVLHPQQQVI